MFDIRITSTERHRGINMPRNMRSLLHFIIGIPVAGTYFIYHPSNLLNPGNPSVFWAREYKAFTAALKSVNTMPD